MLSSFNIIGVDIFGESHSEEIGINLYNFPAGIPVDSEYVKKFMTRRKAGRNTFSTPRSESDKVEFVKGVTNGFTDGGTIKAIIKNENIRKIDYDNLSFTPRPSHADYVSYIKYGVIPSGGGRFSGRMTAPLCAAGAIAKSFLSKKGIEINAFISSIGKIKSIGYKDKDIENKNIEKISDLPLPVIDEYKKELMEKALIETKTEGDSLGGVIECIIKGAPTGLGGELFNGMEGRLAMSMLAIPGAKGIEFGSGFSISELKGSEANDPFAYDKGKVITLSNHSGGINGGITNGMPINMRIAFRPTPSIKIEQKTVNLKIEKEEMIKIEGRHDVCIVPRAVPCVEACAALVIMDAYLEWEDENEIR